MDDAPDVLEYPIRNIRGVTLKVCLLVAAFVIFFDVSKHNPTLVANNPFLEDPYDAVGSFAVQLALAAVLLSFVRVLRPKTDANLAGSLSLILRGDMVAIHTVIVALAADGIAILRFIHVWSASPAGRLLAAITAALLAISLLVAGQVYQVGRSFDLPAGHRSRSAALAASLAYMGILAFYPDSWRQSIAGAIFTALLGMVILFVLTAVLVWALFPKRMAVSGSEDFLDDLLAIYQWAKSNAPSAAPQFQRAERVVADPKVRQIADWMNPRKHPWNLVVLAGVLMGVGLLVVEGLGEGAPAASRLALVIAVFVGIELSGVLLGYRLFGRYLRIFREG